METAQFLFLMRNTGERRGWKFTPFDYPMDAVGGDFHTPSGDLRVYIAGSKVRQFNVEQAQKEISYWVDDAKRMRKKV